MKNKRLIKKILKNFQKIPAKRYYYLNLEMITMGAVYIGFRANVMAKPNDSEPYDHYFSMVSDSESVKLKEILSIIRRLKNDR